MKKFFLKSVCLILSVAIVFYSFIALLLYLPVRAFEENFQRGFIYQYRALEAEKEAKIVTLGGSNVAFDVDTKLLSSLTGMPAYNLGMHAQMGYCYIFDMAEPLIGKGDKVILPLWPFTMNDYDSNLIWITLEGEPDLIQNYLTQHPKEALTSVGGFGLKKLYNLTFGKIADALNEKFGLQNDGGYNASAFDPESGNLIMPRPNPTVQRGDMLQNSFRFGESSFSDEYYPYINSFIDRVEAKGAKVYFTYPSVMRDALLMTDEEIKEYEAFAKEKFHGTFITGFGDVCYEYEEYFNLASHLNDHGMARYTTDIANGLLAVK